MQHDDNSLLSHIRRSAPRSYAGEKKSPQGQVEDESVAITATILSPEQLKQAVGSDFDNNYTVLDVRIAPKGGKPYLVHLDDFILRSEASGEHSGPFLGRRADRGRRRAGSRTQLRKQVESRFSARHRRAPKSQMKDDDKANPALDALKKKMLSEKTVSEPVSGLLFFPLTKEKAKNLILSYKTPAEQTAF